MDLINSESNTDIEIVSQDQSDYLDYIQRLMKIKSINANVHKDPFSQDSRKLFEDLEKATLELFIAELSIIPGLILKIKRKRISPAVGPYKFFEIDFTAIKDNVPQILGELKLSFNLKPAARKGRKQLRERLSICQKRWPGTKGLVIAYQLPNKIDEGSRLIQSHELFHDSLKITMDSPEDISTLKLNGEDLINDLVGRKLVPTKILDDIANVTFADNYLKSVNEQNDDFNSMENLF